MNITYYGIKVGYIRDNFHRPSTAQVKEQGRVLGEEAGANTYLTKSFGLNTQAVLDQTDLTYSLEFGTF